MSYDYGRGVPKDVAQAVVWYRKAAEQGEADAENDLGLMYLKGRGVPQDLAQANAWFRKAAEQGEAEAQRNLGAMYAQGQGVPRDSVEAYKWYTLAASHLDDAQGRKALAGELELLAAMMTPAELDEAHRKVSEWRGRAGQWGQK